MSTIDELNDLAKKLECNHSDLMQALLNEETSISNSISKKKEELQKKNLKAVKIIKTETANEYEQARIRLESIIPQIEKNDNEVLKVAEYLNVGKMRIQGKEINVSDSIEIPLLIPFIGHSNILLSTETHDESVLSIREIVYRAFLQTAPGQLEVIVYDPQITNTMSPFRSLMGDNNYINVINQQDKFESVLSQIIDDVQEIQNQMQGLSSNLVEFRNKIKQPIGVYRIIVILDFRFSNDDKIFGLISTLMKSSPTAGFSFIVCNDNNHDEEINGIRNICERIRISRKTITWENNNLTANFDITDVNEMVSNVGNIVRNAYSLKIPPVWFSKCEDEGRIWQESSADGVSFAVGKSGLDNVVVTLGDDVSQKHNVIITGAVGQGKSNLIKIIIHSLCLRYSPNEINLYLLDFKEGVTLFPFSNIGKADYLPHAKVLGLESDRMFGLAVLEHIENEFNSRSKKIKPYGDNISKYRAANPNEKMPRIILIIDEFHFLFNKNDDIGEKAADMLDNLARKGRAYGIHIILASQTITGAAALLTRQDGILGQFPIRIALKNNLSESYATFVQGNDAAAKLRLRGQAVINYDYGDAERNKIFTVAYADDKYFDELRKAWWSKVKNVSMPPVVFDGSALHHIGDDLPFIKTMRSNVINNNSFRYVCLGAPISVNQDPVITKITDDPGCNIAILGSGDNSKLISSNDVPTNNAIGIIQAIAITLALQHPNGDARFILLDSIDKSYASKNNYEVWISIMEHIGYPVEIVEKARIGSVINEIAEKIDDNSVDEGTLYILGVSMDNAGNLNKADPDTFVTPADSLAKILSDGSSLGIHFIGCWKNVSTFKKHIGYDGEGYIETKIILHMDQNNVRDIIDPLTNWSSEDNRALVSDQSIGSNPLVIIPYSPVTNADKTKIISTEWG